MKIFVWSNGDSAANITGQEATINFPYLIPNNEEDKKMIKEQLSSAFSEIFDSKAHVLFEEEYENLTKEN